MLALTLIECQGCGVHCARCQGKAALFRPPDQGEVGSHQGRVPDTDGHGAEGLDKVWPSARRHPAVVGDDLAPGIETHTLGDPAVADNGQWLRQLSQEVELAMVRTVAAFAFPHAQVNR